MHIISQVHSRVCSLIDPGAHLQMKLLVSLGTHCSCILCRCCRLLFFEDESDSLKA
jgi:hypothetical protein